MPSGLRVRGRANYWGMDIYVFAPRLLRGNIEGLCGNYDGASDNDLYPKGTNSNSPNDNSWQPNDFIRSFRY